MTLGSLPTDLSVDLLETFNLRDDVQRYGGVVSQAGQLVHCGQSVKLATTDNMSQVRTLQINIQLVLFTHNLTLLPHTQHCSMVYWWQMYSD